MPATHPHPFRLAASCQRATKSPRTLAAPTLPADAASLVPQAIQSRPRSTRELAEQALGLVVTAPLTEPVSEVSIHDSVRAQPDGLLLLTA